MVTVFAMLLLMVMTLVIGVVLVFAMPLLIVMLTGTINVCMLMVIVMFVTMVAIFDCGRRIMVVSRVRIGVRSNTRRYGYA